MTLKTIPLLLLLPVLMLVASACGEGNEPTPTVDGGEKIDELYWLQVDFVVEQTLGIPDVSRKIDFDFLMGHTMLVIELSNLHEQTMVELENNGIVPLSTKPFCAGPIMGLWLLAEMTQQQTPAESLGYVSEMLQLLQDHEAQLNISSQDQGTYDPEWCDGLAEEFDTTIPELFSKLGRALDDMIDDIDIDEFRELIYQ